jgi:hypothetical protein
MDTKQKQRAVTEFLLLEGWTGDESVFDFEYVRDRLWISSLENVPNCPNRTMATEKQMLTVVWNPGGFQVVTILPTGASFNAA